CTCVANHTYNWYEKVYQVRQADSGASGRVVMRILWEFYSDSGFRSLKPLAAFSTQISRKLLSVPLFSKTHSPPHITLATDHQIAQAAALQRQQEFRLAV